MATNRSSRLVKIVTGAQTGAGEEPPVRASEMTRLEHFAHFWVLVFRSFVDNRCLVRASSLSFFTLLALVPMLAVAISVTSSMFKTQGEDEIYKAIDEFVSTLIPPATMSGNPLPAAPNLATSGAATILTNVTANPEPNLIGSGVSNEAALTNAAASTAENGGATRVTAQKQAAKFIHKFIQNTQSSTLGILGTLTLVSVAISMLATIESAFNDIWGVTRGRSWLWRIFVYWGVLTLGPLALAAASSLVGSSHLEMARHLIERMPIVGELFFKVLSLLIVSLVLALLYLTMPHTKVRFGSAMVGGLLGGSLWYVNNLLGYLFISRVSSNNLVYGSLGLLPVLMAGLYFSWAILLFGVQVSYAFQNRQACLEDKFAENVNQRGREFIALRLMTCLGLRYQNGQAAASVGQIAAELGISTRLTEQIIRTLQPARLISEVAGAEPAYFPARPLEAINAHQVLLAMRSVNKPLVFACEEPVRDEIYGEFARIEEAERAAAAGVTMQALVDRARAKLDPAAVPAPGTTLVLVEPAAPAPKTVAMELTVDPLPEGVAEAVPAAAPIKPVRKIFAPEDNQDFPL
jgi:membrane protein